MAMSRPVLAVTALAAVFPLLAACGGTTSPAGSSAAPPEQEVESSQGSSATATATAEGDQDDEATFLEVVRLVRRTYPDAYANHYWDGLRDQPVIAVLRPSAVRPVLELSRSRGLTPRVTVAPYSRDQLNATMDVITGDPVLMELVKFGFSAGTLDDESTVEITVWEEGLEPLFARLAELDLPTPVAVSVDSDRRRYVIPLPTSPGSR